MPAIVRPSHRIALERTCVSVLLVQDAIDCRLDGKDDYRSGQNLPESYPAIALPLSNSSCSKNLARAFLPTGLLKEVLTWWSVVVSIGMKAKATPSSSMRTTFESTAIWC